MLLKKFWFLICAFFLFQSLNDVYNDSRYVQFNNDNNKVKIFNFSFCIKLDKELLKNFKKTSNNLYQFTVKELVESTCHQFFSNDTCYSSINLNRSYLFNYHSCLVFKDEDFDTLIKKLIDTDFEIFAFSNYISEIYFSESVFRNDAKLEPLTLNLKYTEYHRLEQPYETNCYRYSNENINFKTKEIVNSRPSCLYECFKTESRSLNYYYSRRDNESLIVYEDDLKSLKGIGKWRNFDKKLTINLENKCLNECKKSGCIIRVFIVNEFKGTKQTKFNLTYRSNIFSAKPSTSKTQIIINLISLIVLFLNISFYETLPYLIKKILSIYLKKHMALFNKYYWILKLIILILCSIIIICLSLFRIFEYLDKDFNKLVAFNFPTEISTFYLMICVPVQVFIGNHNKLDEEKEKKLLKINSFAQLENLSDFAIFKSRLERIYIKYASIEKDVNYSIDETKIVFKYFDYEFENYTNSNFLLRCYKIDINIRELRYEMLYSLSKLKIILKLNWYIVYPISKDFNLTTGSMNLISDPYLYKVIQKRLFNCSDYSKNKLFSNLTNHENAIDQCVNEEHLKNYGNLTIQSVINKDTISLEYNLNRIYFNQSINQNIFNRCRIIFQTYNCLSEYFKINKRKPLNQMNRNFSMNLYYVEHIILDDIILSLSDLLLNNLLSFESIFIGLNIGKLLIILFILLKSYKLDWILKYFNSIKFIILLIGLSIHLYYIIYDILNSEQILITKYPDFKSIQLPNLIFCFKIKNYNRIDLNHKKTLNYLDNFTKNLNLTFFKNLSFLDNDLNAIFFTPYNMETIQNLDEIHTIYFLNFKCFEFVFKLIDNNRFYHILNVRNFVSFKFNRETISKYYKKKSKFTFYLIARKKLTNELNGIEKIKFNYYDHNFFRVYQKLNILKVEEKFTFFHNPLSFLYNSVDLDDTTEYINQLLDDLRKFNLRTTKIMNSIDFNNETKNIEIDDELFDQYFYQIKNVTDFNSIQISNYQREIYITNIIENHSKKEENYDIYFHFHHFLETYKFTNRDNYSKFIISILNCLNIWLNFCCLDLYIYLQKFCNLIYRFYRIVLRFKFYLKRKKSQILMQSL